MKTSLEYIWLDGVKPTAKMRSKTKIIDFVPTLETTPIWGFDGSSTNQATGHNSDCVLKPVKMYKDVTRQNGFLVLCEVYNVDGTAHPTNDRHKLVELYEKHKDLEPLFGIEQEYTFFSGSRPLGFPEGGFPAPQGRYYCGVGADEVFGRDIVEEHLQACIDTELLIEGINAEVMPGQWEFQIGTGNPLDVSDDMWIARYLLYRIAEKYKVNATLDPKPVHGDWNGAGAHTNYSTKKMREDWSEIERVIKTLQSKHAEHFEVYGDGNEARLTGHHETCSWKEFKYGISDRGASVRIPWHVAKNKMGYIEDRRPAANMNPYIVTAKIIETTSE